VFVRRTNLDGDRQADPVVHGGEKNKVLKEGPIQAGDEIKRVGASPNPETMTEMVRAVKKKRP